MPCGARLSRRALLAGTAGSVIACRQSHGTEAPGRLRAERIPIVYDQRGGLFIDAAVDGGERARFILDTGAGSSTLSKAFAAKLGRPVERSATIDGSAGSVESEQTLVDVDIPGTERLRSRFAVYEFGTYDPRCVGILGQEWLRREPFQLRYADRVLVWRAEPTRKTLPMVLDRGIPRIGDVRVNGTSIDVRIDSGASSAPSADAYVNLTQDQAALVGLDGEPVRTLTATGTGSEVLKLPVHRLARFEVAGLVLEPAFAIVQPRVGYFARPSAVGFLGNAVLDKLDPFFDYARGLFGVERST